MQEDSVASAYFRVYEPSTLCPGMQRSATPFARAPAGDFGAAVDGWGVTVTGVSGSSNALNFFHATFAVSCSIMGLGPNVLVHCRRFTPRVPPVVSATLPRLPRWQLVVLEQSEELMSKRPLAKNRTTE